MQETENYGRSFTMVRNFDKKRIRNFHPEAIMDLKRVIMLIDTGPRTLVHGFWTGFQLDIG